jgi:hypothetical protein
MMNDLLMWLPPLLGATQLPDMADVLRESGKIYVVVLVIGVIFTGILLYLVALEGKIRTMEKIQKYKK